MDPGVHRALVAWRDKYHPKAKPGEAILRDGHGERLYAWHMTANLRARLEEAGVKRQALYVRHDARIPLRAHDLRATFVTLALMNSKTETWVADRTGHKSSDMINTYRRAARSAMELGLGTMTPLDEAIPELMGHG